MEQHQANETPAFDLNSLERYQNSRNAPLYDITTSDGFESVKAYNNADRALSHLCDLQSSESWETSAQRSLREKFAQAIVDNAEKLQAAGVWPEGLSKDAGVAEVIDYERDHGKMIVPDDIAEQVREELPSEIRENPEPWGVDPNSPTFEADVQERAALMAERVEGFGKTSAECQQCAEANAEASAAAAAGAGTIHDLAMPQPEGIETAPSAEPAQSSSQGGAVPPPQPPPLFPPV
jgi:hypothetical protein